MGVGGGAGLCALRAARALAGLHGAIRHWIRVAAPRGCAVGCGGALWAAVARCGLRGALWVARRAVSGTYLGTEKKNSRSLADRKKKLVAIKSYCINSCIYSHSDTPAQRARLRPAGRVGEAGRGSRGEAGRGPGGKPGEGPRGGSRARAPGGGGSRARAPGKPGEGPGEAGRGPRGKPGEGPGGKPGEGPGGSRARVPGEAGRRGALVEHKKLATMGKAGPCWPPAPRLRRAAPW